MPDQEGYTTGELARLVASAMARMESLAARLEGGQFVSSETFRLNNEKTDLRFQRVDERLGHKASADDVKNLRDEVSSLKDDRKWLVRLLVSFIVLGVLAVWVAAAGGVQP